MNVDASSSSDSDGFLTGYSWDWDDGTPDSSGVTVSHTYTAVGVYEIALTIADDDGATGTTTQVVVVSTGGNLAPSAHIESWNPTTGTAPVSFQFDGHGHDDAGPLIHHWDFGDGSAVVTITGLVIDVNSQPSHTYDSAGTFMITLTVEDSQGLTDTHSIQVTVSPAPGEGGGGGCGLLGMDALLLLWFVCRRRISHAK